MPVAHQARPGQARLVLIKCHSGQLHGQEEGRKNVEEIIRYGKVEKIDVPYLCASVFIPVSLESCSCAGH